MRSDIEEHEQQWLAKSRGAERISAAIAIVFALAGLSRWMFGVPSTLFAKSWTVVMAPLTAMLLLLSGAGLLLARSDRRARRRLAAVLGIVVAFCGVVRLIELATGANLLLGWLSLNVPQFGTGARSTGFTSFPSSITAALTGSALAVLATRQRNPAWRVLASGCAAVSTAFCAVFLLGYAYERPLTFQGAPVGIAPNTAAAFMLLGVGLVYAVMSIESRERALLIRGLEDAKERLENRVATRTAELTHTLAALRAESEERRLAEAKFVQAQRVETVSLVAGSVVHDFNNLLTAIVGFVTLAERETPDGSPARRFLSLIREASVRAVGLTRRLLSVARREPSQREVLDVSHAMRAMDVLIRPMMGERIAVTTELEPGLWPVRADRAQLEQVLLNLCVNARDAMPSGGELRIRVSNVTYDSELPARPQPVPPGRYVRLEIRDRGVGMNEDVRSRLFEPFFTTKPAGVGTGLGLAASRSIVIEHGGFITVESEVGVGTAFCVYLERWTGALTERRVAGANAPTDSASSPVIVVLDDEPLVLNATAALLRAQGRPALTAATVEEAIAAIRSGRGGTLVLADVSALGSPAERAVASMIEASPSVRVALMSGYGAEAVSPIEGVHPRMLAKPFTADELKQFIEGFAAPDREGEEQLRL